MPPPTPSTAPARSGLGGGAGVPGSKTAQKSIKKIIIFLDQFLIRFGSHLEAVLAPFLLHFWFQIALGYQSLSKT